MRRKTPALAALLALLCALTAIPAASGTTSFCGDSWGSDGHSGPWYTAPSTLHGNTLDITCPSGSTIWNVTYTVHKTDGAGRDLTPISIVRNGNGTTSWSASLNPVGCNPGWLYYTQVRNNVTGNYIRKPQNGKVIC